MNLRFWRRSPTGDPFTTPREQWPLHMTLFSWLKNEPFTLEDACKGVQVWGMTGSGKSSGSGRLIATSYLRAGFGGLVLCAKPGETDTWREYCRRAGREDDLVVFSPTAPWRLNYLDAELQRPGAGAGLTENLLQLFMTVSEIASRGTSGGAGREDEGYWKRALSQLLRNAIDLLVIATHRVSVPELYKIVVSAPTSFEQANAESWQKKSYCWRCLQDGSVATKIGYQAHDFQLVADYFLLEFPGLSEKTRSVVVSTFTSMIDVLNRGVLRELFCTTTNLTPEDILTQGKVIVIDLPVKVYAEVGQFAAVLWKFLFQRAVERRDVREYPRPCFLFADESQLFTTSFDALFQTTARSSRCATVYLTQNLNNYLAAYGQESGTANAKSLLGNLTCQIVHALADADTAQYVADLIGRRRQTFANGSITHQPYNPMDDFLGRGGGQVSGGYSESFEYDVQPAELGRMRTGGITNQYLVDALIWRGGQPFASTGRSYLWTSFHQL
jgi:TraM recognition site of TraD and TraG